MMRWSLTALGLIALMAGFRASEGGGLVQADGTHFPGAPAYAFSVMLFSFLLGIGSGGWLGGPLAASSTPRAV